jgi:hypothetical protein
VAILFDIEEIGTRAGSHFQFRGDVEEAVNSEDSNLSTIKLNQARQSS